ncbi:MAG: tRNA (guanosine(46)-N7)-methyltransferase TrmB [Anaerolinea sp.]|nr:tRNA (guanosine(46)-N7)-methyltransferase TrmB [Anaerolinea sp.]
MREKLSGYDLAWTTDWAALFGVQRPLILEIGFGRGAFLRYLAGRFPDHNIVGVEVSNRCLVAGESLIARENLTNVRVIHSTAEMALYHLFEPASIEQIYINFPDPWFKPGHSHRRLMQRDTLDAMVNRLSVGGELTLATDIAEYAELTAALLAETPGLTNLLPSAWVNAMPERVVTKYEQIARREGRTCYYFAHRRNELPAPDVPVIREWAMPHIVFTSPLTLDEMGAQFAEFHHDDGDLHIHFMGVYRGRGALLFEVHVGEATIVQRIAFLVSDRAKREGREYTLQVSALGHPRATKGVHKAVGLLGAWLLSLHPDAQPVINKVAINEDE